MIRRVPLRLRLVSFAALILGLGNAMWAQEKGGGPGSAGASNDAIAEAKRNFDEIKTAREAALLPGGQVPHVSLPELSLPSAPPSAAVVPKSKASTDLIPQAEALIGGWSQSA